MQVFNHISDAIKYAIEKMNATNSQAEKIREQLEAKSVAKFHGIYLFYDELYLID